MPEKPSREYYVRLFQEKARVDSGLRRLHDIVGCPTYGLKGGHFRSMNSRASAPVWSAANAARHGAASSGCACPSA